jgi:hydroxymethylpyrimidine pyrophosphatase-like HAD family hydrolase
MPHRASMRYRALATDYDGTLAHDGRVDDRTAGALERLRASGRRLVLVTGRIRADLERVFPRVDLFDLVVAENGATLWRPGGDERLLAPPPPVAFVELLRARGVPLDVGHVVVATREPHDAAVLDAIHELGLDLQLVFNKGAVMVLPPAVTKASGLAAALEALGVTEHEVVAAGDAENDIVMLTASECAVAVANALPSVKRAADHVTAGARGAGVVEVVEALLADDLASVDPPRHRVELGTLDAAPVAVSPWGTRVVVGGAPESARAARTIVERVNERGYQVCLVHAGAFGRVRGLAPIGSAERAPQVEEVGALLAVARASVAVDLAGMPAGERPRFLARLALAMCALRERTGRPHWLALDEAHHLVPREVDGVAHATLRASGSLLVVTEHPDALSDVILRATQVVIGAAPIQLTPPGP